MSTLASWWFNEIFGDFLTGEYFLNIGGMILRVTKDDLVRERHFNGATIAPTVVLTQKYYDPFSETEKDYQALSGKEILCYLEAKRSGGGQFATVVWKVWASPVKDDKADAAARDVFGRTFNSNTGPTTTPPFILRPGEYLNIETVTATTLSTIVSKIVGVERNEVP